MPLYFGRHCNTVHTIQSYYTYIRKSTKNSFIYTMATFISPMQEETLEHFHSPLKLMREKYESYENNLQFQQKSLATTMATLPEKNDSKDFCYEHDEYVPQAHHANACGQSGSKVPRDCSGYCNGQGLSQGRLYKPALQPSADH